MNSIKIWKFFIPYYGIYYVFICGKTFGFKQELPISNFTGISIAVIQAIYFWLVIVILIKRV